ncbi:MAG: hypothetical protein ACP5M0_15895, partial [Desulfomonilaceae bacterium]
SDAHRHLLAAVMSHVAGDAITLINVVRQVMVMYHEIVTGSQPELVNYQMAASTTGKRQLRRRETVLRDYALTCRHAFEPYKRCSLPLGTGLPADRGEHHVKATLTQDETTTVVKRAATLRISLVDYLLASGVETVRIWNDSRGCRASAVTAALTVNLDGRAENCGKLNNDSVVYFRCTEDEMSDLRALGRAIFRSRMRQFREHLDVKYARGMEKLANVARLLPFKLRKYPYQWLLQKHQTSFALGFMGVLWPKTNGRSLTGESYLVSVGGLEIAEVHGMAYKIFSRTPLYLSAYIFQQRLNLILSAAARHFTKAEAADFLQLMVCTLCPGAGRKSS